MNGCKTCGSRGASLPHNDEWPESAKCQCGFRQNTEICSNCYTRFPHREDENGVDVSCPQCGKFVAYFQWSRM